MNIHPHAALGTAKRQINDRALHGHQEGERLDLVDSHIRVEANAALGRAERVVIGQRQAG